MLINQVKSYLKTKLCITCKKHEAIYFESQECYSCDKIFYEKLDQVTNFNKIVDGQFERYKKKAYEVSLRRKGIKKTRTITKN